MHDSKRSRRGSVILVLCLAILVALMLGGTSYIASQRSKERRVFLSPNEKYYYHTLCVRACSLGLTESSPTYPESVAIEQGYQLVPTGLRDTVCSQIQQSAESETYAQHQETGQQNMQDLLNSELDTLRQRIRTAILRGCSEAGRSVRNAHFSQWKTTQTDSNAFRFDVLLDLYGDGRITEWWYAEMAYFEGTGWELVAVDAQITEQSYIRDLQRVTYDWVLEVQEEPLDAKLHRFRYERGPGHNVYTVYWAVKPKTVHHRGKTYQLTVEKQAQTWELKQIEEVKREKTFRY